MVFVVTTTDVLVYRTICLVFGSMDVLVYRTICLVFGSMVGPGKSFVAIFPTVLVLSSRLSPMYYVIRWPLHVFVTTSGIGNLIRVF